MIGIVILFSKMFACTDSGGGGCIPLELIPEGYRAQQYQQDNPVLTNTTQVRITQDGLDFVKNNLGKIVKAVVPDMYIEDDINGNARVRFCVPSEYGKQGLDYGVASRCSQSDCDLCYDNTDHGASCENQLIPLAKEYTKYRIENKLWETRNNTVTYEVQNDDFVRVNMVGEKEVFYSKSLKG